MSRQMRVNRRLLLQVLCVPVVIALSACQLVGAQRSGFVNFERELIADGIGRAQQVAVVDVDGDGLADLVVLADGRQPLGWYRNPDWQRHDISLPEIDPLAMAPGDINGNGLADIALAARGGNVDESRLYWFQNPATLPGQSHAGEWAVHGFGVGPQIQQLSWARLGRRGMPVLVALPTAGNGGRLQAWTPESAAGPTERWASVALHDVASEDRAMLVYDWNGDGREQLLLGGPEGVDLFSLASAGRFLDRRQLVASPVGSSVLAVGHSGRPERRFLATIEPEQGGSVVLYRPQPDAQLPWQREVLDGSLMRGRALLAADLNNDGFDELITGDSEQPFGLYVYRYDRESRSWQRSTIDRGRVAVSDLMVADLTGNGFKDIVAIGAGTQNLIVYRNSGR